MDVLARLARAGVVPVVVIDDAAVDHSVVGLGSFVKVEKNGVEVEYKIVGSNEADPMSGKISDLSPIGRGLLGKKAGDAVTIAVPAGTVSLKVLSVSRAQK